VAALKEVRWHGRGGQGAWTASAILAKAALYEGKHIQSFPEFGPERMGAPIKAYTRISDVPIDVHCSVYSPDIVVVLDPTLLKTVAVTEGLKENGVILANTRLDPQELRESLEFKGGMVWAVPATDIAIKILNRDIPNTAMIGAVVRATELVNLEKIKMALEERFPSKIAQLNKKVVEVAYKEARSE
jgi:pyruvate ferredoxin oxidoreductase gamma subunit